MRSGRKESVQDKERSKAETELVLEQRLSNEEEENVEALKY